MSYYKICSRCGANLDPGEVCDCKEEAAPGATNTRGGKAEQIDTAVSASIVTESKEDRKR